MTKKTTYPLDYRYLLRRTGQTGIVERIVDGEPTGKQVLRLRWRGGESPGWTYEGCEVWFDEWRDAVTHWEKTHPNHQVAGLIDALREHLSPHAVVLIAAKCQPCYGKGEAGQSAEREVAWFTEMLIGMVGISEYEQLCDEVGV